MQSSLEFVVSKRDVQFPLLNTKALIAIEDLPRVHAIVGVERTLEGAHQFERLAMFRDEILLFTEPNPVLAGAGAAHRLRALHQTHRERVDFSSFLGRIHALYVKIAVANVADDGGREGSRVYLGTRRDDALG